MVDSAAESLGRRDSRSCHHGCAPFVRSMTEESDRQERLAHMAGAQVGSSRATVLGIQGRMLIPISRVMCQVLFCEEMSAILHEFADTRRQCPEQDQGETNDCQPLHR